MPASGTYGFGLEYLAYGDPSLLGAVVVKSLSARPWAGNPEPRLHPLEPDSMLNSIGLPNPGVERWVHDTLPDLLASDVRVVASIWGHTPEELLDAARLMTHASGVIAWEVNLSCPNLSTSRDLPSHNPVVARELCSEIRRLAADSVGIWAKLAPHASDIAAVAGACMNAGVDAVTMTNTYPGMKIDIDTRRPVLGAGGGGISGRALKPIALNLVRIVRHEHPDLPIVAAGGVLTVDDAFDYFDAGANAVQVGTANFLDPRSTHTIASGVVSRLASARSVQAR
jgi:dihydroorotate dehydrogenase (NAD+) catalytic subunit